MDQFSDLWYSYQLRYCSVNNSGLWLIPLTASKELSILLLKLSSFLLLCFLFLCAIFTMHLVQTIHNVIRKGFHIWKKASATQRLFLLYKNTLWENHFRHLLTAYTDTNLLFKPLSCQKQSAHDPVFACYNSLFNNQEIKHTINTGTASHFTAR